MMQDEEWAAMMLAVRRIRNSLTFSARRVFDEAFRPEVDGGRIAYPDAFYHATRHDLDRAMTAVGEADA
jgi:hypothetical protein